MPEGPVTETPGGVRIAVRVTPKASRNAIAGIADAPDGRRALRVHVTAAPEGGKANAAVLRLLAKTWKLPRTSLVVVAGDTARRKVIEVSGEPEALSMKLREWIETADGDADGAGGR